MMTLQPEPHQASAQASAPRSAVVAAGARLLLQTTALVALYYLLPLDRTISRAAVTWLVLGLIAFVVLAAVQVRSILRSSYPALRAVEALSTAVPLFVLVFASTYLLLAASQQGAFNEPMNKTDALYFTMSVFSTVGFGDIVPRTEVARLTVTLQMVGNLIVLGVLARIVVGAVQLTRQRRAEHAVSAERRS